MTQQAEGEANIRLRGGVRWDLSVIARLEVVDEVEEEAAAGELPYCTARLTRPLGVAGEGGDERCHPVVAHHGGGEEGKEGKEEQRASR